MTDDEKIRRRRMNTEWSRKRNEKKLAAQLMGAQRCPRGHGGGICGGPLRTTTGDNGRTLVICDYCERRKAGICRDCSRPVYGARFKAIRCAEHAEIARQAQCRAHTIRNREEINARARVRDAERTPEKRQLELEKKKLWRLANPDKVRASKQRYAKRYGDKKESRYLEYHRRYNAQATRAKRKRAQSVAAYYRDNPVRPNPKCTVCGTPIAWTPGRGRPASTCDAHCSKYELAARIRRREAAAMRTPEPNKQRRTVRPIKVKNPMPARYAESGERLCLTPGCDIVVTHRKKKCTKCRERSAAAAREALGRTAGRGRRTDLEVAA